MVQKMAQEGLVEHISTFIDFWDHECESTEKLLQDIPEDLLYKELIPGYRSIAKLAWHIVHSPKEMLERTGLKIQGPEAKDPVPKNLDEIIQAHQTVWQSVKDRLSSQWNDSMLRVTDEMYGEEWSRGFTLTAILHHLIHHRGQMTALLRLGGARVRGIYGPAKEEWAAYGLTPED